MKLPTFTLSRSLRRAALGLLLATAGAAQAQTTSFAFTGSPQTYTVPPGVTRLQVVATGAGGATVFGTPARGAQVTATLAVTPGERLTVVVGSQPISGDNAGPGGYNGGGSGGSGGGVNRSGGGGGATDLRRSGTSTGDYLTTRNALVVAGGAGGSYGSAGGDGGTPAGGNGATANGSNSTIGQGATQQGPGAGGVSAVGNNGSAGSTGQGGTGGFAAGGGGGGGYYGGGGGATGGGGGGGSSWVTASASSVSYSLAAAAGNGALTITPLYAMPTLTSLSPTSGPVGTSVTLTGTDLSSATAVSFNNTAASFTANANGTLTATVPSGATSGNVTVTTPGGTSNGVAFTVTQPTTAAPVITTPAPNTVTNQSSVDVSGTAPANSTVTLYYSPSGSTQPQTSTASTTGTFRYSLLALSDGTYTVYATAQSSGASVSPNSNTITFTVDTTPPTVTSLSSAAGSSTSTAPIPFAVSFSEAVTGFTASGISVSNGTVSSGSLSGSGSQYTFSVAPTGSGPVTVSIRANAAQDAATNSNPASNAVSVQYTAPVASGLSVRYQTGDLGQPTDNQLRPFLQLVNTGASPVPYSSLTVRYWLTPENFMGSLVTPIDYAKLGTGFVSARYVALAAPQQGAYGYIEYSFAAGAGNLAAGTDSGPIYGKAYKPDYSNFDETDDWSYQTSSSFTANDHITLYQNGTLIAGTEPPAVTAQLAAQVYTASRDASASTQYISVQLQFRNTGNVPINYSDVRIRYYFTREGARGSVTPEVDYAKLGNSNFFLRIVDLPAPIGRADAYLEIRPLSGAGVLYPGSSSGDLLFKLRKDDYSAFDQTNDYSFNSSPTLVLNTNVTLLVQNRYIFGTAPAGAPYRVAAPSAASGATIVAASSGPQVLTASPNPFGEQLTLRFALSTTQAYSLAVYDGQGRLVQQAASGEAEAGQAQQVAVSTQAYAAGLYLVRLSTADGVQTLKLVKQ